MNQKDKQQLALIKDRLTAVKNGLATIWEKEDEKFNNLSEGLQETPIGVKIDDVRSELGSAISSIEEAEASIINILEDR